MSFMGRSAVRGFESLRVHRKKQKNGNKRRIRKETWDCDLAVSCGPTVEENVECKDSVAVQTVDTIQIVSDSTAVDTVKSE